MNDKSVALTPKAVFTTVNDMLTENRNAIQMALPKTMSVDRIIRVALTTIRKNPLLLKCDPKTLFAGILQAAEVGLTVSTPLGHAHLVPYRNRRTGGYDGPQAGGTIFDYTFGEAL